MSAKEKNSGDKSTDRRSRLSALASDVPALTRLALGKRGFAEADLVSQWAAIVGDDIARLALPVKLRLPRPPAGGAKTPQSDAGIAPNVSGGTLTLRASPAASLEVQHLGPRILERVAAYFGYPLIREIRLEIGERRRRTSRKRMLSTGPEPDLPQVADPDLRHALQRLGAARAADKRRRD